MFNVNTDIYDIILLLKKKQQGIHYYKYYYYCWRHLYTRNYTKIGFTSIQYFQIIFMHMHDCRQADKLEATFLNICLW